MQSPVVTNNIETLSSTRENHYFDRKSARIKPEDLARHVVAFANASGGKVVVGIEDDGTVTGFARQGARDPERFEQCAITDCSPAPDVSCTRVPATNASGEDDFVLVMDVEPSTDRVITRRKDGAVFLRQGDQSKTLGYEQIRALEYDKNQRVFEDELVEDSGIGDVDREVLARYKEILGTDAPDEQVLRARRFMRDGRLTVAGLLLFGECPAAFLPQARVRVLRFDGTKMETGERLNTTKDVTFDGPIPKVVDGAFSLISGMLREFQFLGGDGRFQTVPEYPEFAWFEGLVNAVTHRDYAYAGDYIRVSMYDDRLEILSGVYDGKSTGTPLAFQVRNMNQKSGDYDALKDVYRPSHADYAYHMKYGNVDHRGGGRSSGRETSMRVAGGALAKLALRENGICIVAGVRSIGTVADQTDDFNPPFLNPVTAINADLAQAFADEIDKARMDTDSVGGIVECRIFGLPAGLGEPVFDRLDADLAKAVMSIGACKGVEIGLGFESARHRASQINDQMAIVDGKPVFLSNNSGGIQGGISNGETVILRAAFKPTPSIALAQRTVTKDGQEKTIGIKGRHDPCIVPRAVVVVEAMCALTVLDHLLSWRAYE